MRKPGLSGRSGHFHRRGGGFARRHPDALHRPARVCPEGTAQGAAPPAGRTAPRATPPEEWNNLFAPGDGNEVGVPSPRGEREGGFQGPRTAFVLVGTIVSSTPSARRAILWASGMKEPKAFRVKEEVEPGAFLASVERGTVWLFAR